MRAESSAGRYNRNVLVFENMDEILSQRSQESFAESEDRSMTIPRRLSNNNQRTLSARSSISWSRQQGGSQLVSSIDPDEFSGTAGLVNKPLRFTKRHSSTNLLSTSRSSSSSSSSISDGELIDRRLTKLSSGTIHVPPRARPAASFEVDSEDEFIAGDRRSRFLACLGCFNSRGERDASGFRRMSPPPQRSVQNQEKKSSITSNALCKSVERILNLLSERTEIDVLDVVDQRVVFLLYSALSGEPLLNPSEYADCDEWLDWLVLGFSSHSLDAFERDVNRHGSQAMGLLFHVFFSIEFTQLAQICCVIIRNIHLDPASLYGLFAVNCSKWTRDVILAALRRFEERPHQQDDNEVPLLFQKGQDEEKFKSFMTVMDAWISCGAWGSMEAVENRFSDAPRKFGKYKSFFPPEEEEAADAISSDGPAEFSCWSADGRKAPACRIERVDDLALLRRTVLVGSIYYTYTMLSFAKFWLQKDLISVDSEAARERLNNAYLDREFVSKLMLSASMPLAELLRSIDKLSTRVLRLWKSSGWRKEDLLGTHVDERNSAI